MIDYARMQKEFPKQKAALTRAKNSGDIEKAKLYGPAIGTRAYCQDCELEIEYVPGGYGSWHDRGGNHDCPKTGYNHIPND